METDLFHFFALLANATDSLIGVRIQPGMRVARWTTQRVVRLLEELEGLPHSELHARITDQFCCTTDDREHTYVLTGSVRFPVVSPDSTTDEFVASFIRHERFNAGIRRRLSAARLYADGNLAPAGLYIYRKNGSAIDMDTASTRVGFIKRQPYSIPEGARRDLEHFIAVWEPPFIHDYLQLAFENFDESFEAHNSKIEFLNLMIALEVLFNQGTSEMRYRISRGAAVLLARSQPEAQDVFASMTKLYDTRSQLVHTGSAKRFSDEDVMQLRSIVRKSIVAAADLDLSKEELAQWITWKGYG